MIERLVQVARAYNADISAHMNCRCEVRKEGWKDLMRLMITLSFRNLTGQSHDLDCSGKDKLL